MTCIYVRTVSSDAPPRPPPLPNCETGSSGHGREVPSPPAAPPPTVPPLCLLSLTPTPWWCCFGCASSSSPTSAICVHLFCLFLWTCSAPVQMPPCGSPYVAHPFISNCSALNRTSHAVPSCSYVDMMMDSSTDRFINVASPSCTCGMPNSGIIGWSNLQVQRLMLSVKQGGNGSHF